jgi:hypothetical protein
MYQIEPSCESKICNFEIGVVLDVGEDDAERLDVQVEDVVLVDVVQAGTDLSNVTFALGFVEHKI